jgi:hypothetical protein
MKPRFMLNSFGCALIVIAILGGSPALASPVHADASDKGRRNVLFITCDQRMFQPVRAKGFRQPALDRLADRGVTFANHYIASAVCTPSRGVIYSGLTPQMTGIQEEMMFGCENGVKSAVDSCSAFFWLVLCPGRCPNG